MPEWKIVNAIADDRVSLLESSPLGMFIYNLRVLFFLSGTIFMLGLTTVVRLYQWELVDKIRLAVNLLWLALLLGVLINVVLHKSFKQKLLEYQRNGFVGLSALFERYFVIDIVLVVLIVFVGWFYFQIFLEPLLFLVIANLFVYSAYSMGDKTTVYFRPNLVNSLAVPIILVPIFIAWFVLQATYNNKPAIPHEFYFWIFWGPLLGSVWVSIISIATISYLRKKESNSSDKKLQLIVSLIASITEPVVTKDVGSNDQIVDDGLTILLQTICSGQDLFEYQAARVSELVRPVEDKTIPNIQDDLALRTSYSRNSKFKFPEVNPKKLHTTIYPPVGSYTDSVVIPIRHESSQLGFLELYRYQKVLLTQEEHRFFTSLSEVMYFGYRLLNTTQEMLAVNDVDNILDCLTTEQAYKKATMLLHKHLSAQGSMLLLRRKDTKELQQMVAEGFNNKYLDRNKYEVGRGLTGRCVERGELILVNDVKSNLDKFDEELLVNVAKALGTDVIAWMAIPIGEKEDTLGLVKVVNKKAGTGKWFTDYDRRLAELLAEKLKIVLDKFIYLDNLRDAEQRAIERAKAADIEKKKAEQLAKDRQQDLITLTHQLQSPLHASVGRISLMLEDNRLFPSLRTRLEFCNSLLFDAQDQIFGILIATSRESGQKIYISNEKVSAQEITKAIYERMRKTGNRADLKFDYTENDDFPLLAIDKRILGSVLYTLIHNATKYADNGSTVKLECGFEWSLPEKNVRHPAIKVKSVGPPIMFSEKETIFEKFYRGQSVRNTGQYREPGIGLGLWVARNLMRATGGDITLELSNENHRLSVFVIHFQGEENDK